MAIVDILPLTADDALPPPLQNGDHLTREEFERRYNAMPDVTKAELIEGVVYMPSPVFVEKHAEPHLWVNGLLFMYLVATPGVRGADNGSVKMDRDNMPQPDAFLWIPRERGGQARLGEDGYLEGAPELIVEVAATSENYDLHEKLKAYRRNGVAEYLVWRVLERAVDCFILQGGSFARVQLDAGGVYRSAVFPGFWIDSRALITGDLQRVTQSLQQGLSTPEHAAFVERLAASI